MRCFASLRLFAAALILLAAGPASADLQKFGGGGGTLTPGTTPVTGATSCLMYADSASTLQCSAYLTANGTYLSIGGAPTAANAISIQETAGQITFEGATSNTIQTRLAVTDPTSADKTITLPNLTGTVALVNAAQNGPVINVVAAGIASAFCGGASLGNASCASALASFVPGDSTQTPDGGRIGAGSTSNSVHFAETQDAFDFNNGPCGTSACTNPTFIVHSANQDTQEYAAISHDGTAGVLQAANSTQKSGEIKFGRTVALTEAGGAETVITITTATTQSFGLELSYQVRASDATPDYAIREGSLKLVCVNNATAVTCTKDATTQADDESVLINTTAKTLTYAIAVDVTGANVAFLTFDIDSDMVVTAAEITWTAVLNGSGVIS